MHYQQVAYFVMLGGFSKISKIKKLGVPLQPLFFLAKSPYG
jgi:hypothetical protein